jgi:glycosyltransferase involved in cell wall biosynthesis
MRLGIDASNLRSGGGVTHLIELLRVSDPVAHGFSQVIVWGGKAILNQIEDRSWLVKLFQPSLDRSLRYRIFWQRFRLARLARAADCDLLFAPGGSYAGDFRPMVTMCRNMLPFEWRELRRYGCSLTSIRLMLLRWAQSRSFRQAEGLIFLTEYAHDQVMRVVKTASGKIAVVPHGVGDRFAGRTRKPLPISHYSADNPFRILYISAVEMYKHQWHVAEAVARLRSSGLPVALDLVGPGYGPALARLRRTLNRVDRAGEFVRYVGAVPIGEIHARYAEAEACVFASSCENLPNILLEGMASGLPIACSKRGPMPEVLGDAGVYFDPENPDDIARALRDLIVSPELRARLAKASIERAQSYSWPRCARETFAFLAKVSRAHAGRRVLLAYL